MLIGRRPTLPHTCACSTIGAEGLNCRVRDGNGWNPLATVTQTWLGGGSPRGRLHLPQMGSRLRVEEIKDDEPVTAVV